MGTKPLVVVADDDESLRYLLTEVIRDHAAADRFEIIEFDTALPALCAVAEGTQAGRRVLVLSDNRMPGMTGAELIRRARTQNPGADLRLYLMSSAEPPTALAAELSALGAHVMTRPFKLKDLRATVESILDDWMTVD